MAAQLFSTLIIINVSCVFVYTHTHTHTFILTCINILHHYCFAEFDWINAVLVSIRRFSATSNIGKQLVNIHFVHFLLILASFYQMMINVGQECCSWSFNVRSIFKSWFRCLDLSSIMKVKYARLQYTAELSQTRSTCKFINWEFVMRIAF